MIDDTCQQSSTARNRPTNPLAWFGGMIDHCYDFAEAARGAGRPIVGIMCEFTPREIILAAGGVPVCLCGGSASHHPGGRTASAGQPLPAHQVHLRLPPHRQEPLPELGRPGRGGDHLRRQEEDVRAAGRLQADVCAGTAAEGRGDGRVRTLGAGSAQAPGAPGQPVSRSRSPMPSSDPGRSN